MFYVGLDIHSKRISLCVLSETGEVARRSQVRTIQEMMRILAGDALAGTKPQVTLAQVLLYPSWPSPSPRGPVMATIIRFRTVKDTGVHVGLREVWNLVQKMP